MLEENRDQNRRKKINGRREKEEKGRMGRGTETIKIKALYARKKAFVNLFDVGLETFSYLFAKRASLRQEFQVLLRY